MKFKYTLFYALLCIAVVSTECAQKLTAQAAAVHSQFQEHSKLLIDKKPIVRIEVQDISERSHGLERRVYGDFFDGDEDFMRRLVFGKCWFGHS